MRNLIIHKAGVCDEEYKARSANRLLLPRLNVGERMELDGGLVLDLLLPLGNCCAKLILAVDSWLESTLPPPGDGAGI